MNRHINVARLQQALMRGDEKFMMTIQVLLLIVFNIYNEI
jgi:hypothetical protein